MRRFLWWCITLASVLSMVVAVGALFFQPFMLVVNTGNWWWSTLMLAGVLTLVGLGYIAWFAMGKAED